MPPYVCGPQQLLSDTTQGFVGADDLQQILSDALASFSPLAALVGSRSAKSLAHHVTNTKQTFVASMAPIGALGMMSSVSKGANLPGLKDMLGAGDADILDACCELGCGSLYGVVPAMSQRGCLMSATKNRNAGVAACGVVRGPFVLGKDVLPYIDIVKLVMEQFSSSTVTGRLHWTAQNPREQWDLIHCVETLLSQSFNGYDWSPEVFDLLRTAESLGAGRGVLEIHWPAPGMVMETNPWIVYLYGGSFLVVILTLALISTVLLKWQSPAAIVVLLAGQGLLIVGHVTAQRTLKRQRLTKHVDLPREKFSDTWMLVDNVWFTSRLARRKHSHRTLDAQKIRVSQLLRMKSDYVPTWQAVFVLLCIAVGFVAFYVGARSCRSFTILIYIVLFLFVNMTKGDVITYANRSYVTNLNNPGFVDVVNRDQRPSSPLRRRWIRRERPLTEAQATSRNEGSETKADGAALSPTGEKGSPHETLGLEVDQLEENRRSIVNGTSSGSHLQNEPVPPKPLSRESTALEPWNVEIPPSRTSSESWASIYMSLDPADIPLPPSISSLENATDSQAKIEYHVYAKFAVRHPSAIGLFYFSHPSAWGSAAHVIFEACRSTGIHWNPYTEPEPYVYLPFEFVPRQEGEDSTLISAALVLGIDETRHEDIFWSAGMEILSILVDNFTSQTYLCSEAKQSTDIYNLGLYVQYVTRLVLTGAGSAGVEGRRIPGAVSMMRAIDLVRTKYPYDNSEFSLPYLRAAAQAAVAHNQRQPERS